MTQLHAYPKQLVPRDVALQIRSYVRVQWPELDARDVTLRNIAATSDAKTFVVLDGDALVSHAEANFRDIEHGGATYCVGGISAVFTYPAYRKGGFARQVVAAATTFLDASAADLAMLFCGEPLRTFYESCGWVPVERARIYRGERSNPTLNEGTVVMMRFSSEKGRAARETFEHEAVYAGGRTW